MSNEDRPISGHRWLNAVEQHEYLLLAVMYAVMGVSSLTDESRLDHAIGGTAIVGSVTALCGWATRRRGSTRTWLLSTSLTIMIALLIIGLVITKWVSD